MSLYRVCSSCREHLHQTEYNAEQWRKGRNHLPSRCKSCLQEQDQESNTKDEHWFETFQQDSRAFLKSELWEPTLTEHLQEAFQDLVVEGHYDFEWLELAAYRNPKDTQQLLSVGGGTMAITPLNMILKHKPPLYTVHAFVRGNPDSILGLSNTTRETPLRVACQWGAPIPVIRYLVAATIEAFKQHNIDENPIGFLMEDVHKDAHNQQHEIIEALFQGMVVADGSIYGGETFCSLHFFLKYITRPLFPLWLKVRHASCIVDRLLLLLLKEGNFVSQTWEPCMFHDLLSGFWPACINSVAFEIIIEKCMGLCCPTEREDGLPSVLATVIDGRLPLHLAIANKYPVNVVEIILRNHPSALHTRDMQTHLYPFQLAACNDYSTVITSGEWEINVTNKNASEAADWQIIYEDHIGQFFLHRQERNSLDVCYLLLRWNPTLVSS